MKLKIILLCLFAYTLILGAQNLTGVKICVNPGHGGYDSDDRNVVIAPYKSGEQNGFWESQSNLDKGLQLRTMLQAAGATVIMTRTTNTTADDLPLSQIIAMANQANSDFMLAIHSNAGSGVANHVLMIHYGADLTDTNIYNTYNPNNPAQKLLSDKSRAISTEIAKNLYANKLNTWSSGYNVAGDKTFARTAMTWPDGYGVLRGLTVPGVISEGSMHDYIPETYRLMNMEYKWLEAWNFYKSFCTYYNGGTIPTGNVSGMVRDSRIKLESSYNKFAGSDQMLPLNGAKLTLIETNETYTVDQLQNGVYVFKNLNPGTYHVKAEMAGYYAQTKEIIVTANNHSYLFFDLNRVRNTAPQVVSYSPMKNLTDSVDASTDIVLNFNWDMDETSTTNAFSITPFVEGKITYEDTNYRLRFTPNKPLEKSTVYTVKLSKTAKHPDNLGMIEDFSFQFLTKSRNRLALIASNPYDGNNGMHYSTAQFRLIFDKKLNTSNLQTAIKVFDENNNLMIKNIRSIVNNTISSPYGSSYFSLTNNLVEGKTYKLVIDGDVVDEIGMKVTEPIVINFKAVNAQVSNQPIVETFETLNLTYNPSESINSTNNSVSLSSTNLFGSNSVKLSSTLNDLNSKVCYKFINPIALSEQKVLGLHLFGDLSGSEIQLQFSSGAEQKNISLCNLNFVGWEFHELNVESQIKSKDYQLTGINIIRKNSYSFSKNTEILLDNLLLYSKPILGIHNQTISSISIYPNPAKDIIQVKGLTGNAKLKLYTVDGRFIKESTEPRLNVHEIECGTYILKIENQGQTVAKPVFIVK